jgi:hypothetical protein
MARDEGGFSPRSRETFEAVDDRQWAKPHRPLRASIGEIAPDFGDSDDADRTGVWTLSRPSLAQVAGYDLMDQSTALRARGRMLSCNTMSDRRRRIEQPGEVEKSAKRRAKALYPWRPGQSGNPRGSGLYAEARHLARQAGAAVMEALIHLALHAEDERVRSVCCVAVLDRAYGRPREMKEEQSAEQRF